MKREGTRKQEVVLGRGAHLRTAGVVRGDFTAKAICSSKAFTSAYTRGVGERAVRQKQNTAVVLSSRTGTHTFNIYYSDQKGKGRLGIHMYQSVRKCKDRLGMDISVRKRKSR